MFWKTFSSSKKSSASITKTETTPKHAGTIRLTQPAPKMTIPSHLQR